MFYLYLMDIVFLYLSFPFIIFTRILILNNNSTY